MNRLAQLLTSTLVFAWLIVFSCIQSASAESRIDSSLAITSLNGKWLHYSNEYASFVPYNVSVSGFTTNISVWIDTRHYNQYLQFTASPELCLYANNKLLFKFTKNETKHISLSYLKQTIGTPKLFLTFYQPQGKLPIYNASIVANKGINTAHLAQQLLSEGPIERPFKTLNELSIIMLLALVALYIMLKNVAPSNFFPLFNLSSIAQNDIQKYNNSAYRIDNAFTLFITIINIVSISFLIYMIAQSLSQVELLTESLPLANLGLGKSILLVNFILVGCGYLVINFILIRSMGMAFSLKKMSYMHLYEFVRSTTVLSLSGIILGFLSFGAHAFSTAILVFIIESLVLIAFLARCLKMSILLSNLAKFRTVYLFSYLCATEILPNMLIIHLVLNYHGLAGSID